MRESALSLKAGKEFYKKETGFIHYYYHNRPKENHATIPMYENLVYALALFQTKTQESVTEGKELLEKVLSFQNSEGEFPVYLHEFPKASDAFLGAYLFYPLYWISKDFRLVLGTELNQKCDKAIKSLFQALKKRFLEKKPEGHIKIKLAGVFHAMGENLDGILPFADLPLSSNHLADLELAKELGVPELPEWSSLFWHDHLQCYTGPAFKELQEGLEPEVTLLDLMMGAKRQKELTPHHIAASLIRSAPLPAFKEVRGVKHASHWAWAALDKNEDSALSHQPGFHLFRFLTKGEHRLDSLALQGNRILKSEFVENFQQSGPCEILFNFDFLPDFEPDVRDKQREIELFINLGPKIKGSVFALDEPVIIIFEKCQLRITFSLSKGVGDFVGQISRGNRPSQIVKGEAFDQVISLRTLRRSPDARIQMKIQVI